MKQVRETTIGNVKIKIYEEFEATDEFQAGGTFRVDYIVVPYRKDRVIAAGHWRGDIDQKFEELVTTVTASH